MMMMMIKDLFVNLAITISFFGVPQGPVEKFDPYNLNPAYKVKKISTPASQEDLVKTLCDSHIVEFGVPPTANRLALSWAQVALENNRGKKVWNNNLGNQGPFRMNQEYYHHLKRGWPYRSFKSLNESGVQYWKILKKCSMALHAFDAGDAVTAATSLKKCNYYSSNEKQYSLTLNSLYYEAQARLLPKINCG
jgi:hypothetical protein